MIYKKTKEQLLRDIDDRLQYRSFEINLNDGGYSVKDAIHRHVVELIKEAVEELYDSTYNTEDLEKDLGIRDE